MELSAQADELLISVSVAQITELGGIYARQGFSYQDDVAVGCFVEMLTNDELIEVWCETHDDILLVWNATGTKTAEFIQVKSELPDQLWSISKLCERNKASKSASPIGTSLLEKSLARDEYAEPSWFRIVTSRQIHSALQVLTRERGHEHRSVTYEPFKSLVAEVCNKIGDFRSKKNHEAIFWLTNACWKVISEEEIVPLNQQALTKALHKHGLPCEPDDTHFIYGHLRVLAKDAAELGAEKRNQKCITRDHILKKIRRWIQPYPNSSALIRLERKLTDSGLDVVCRRVANDQRRFYVERKRASAYLSTHETEQMEQEILHVLHTLRSSLDSGEIKVNGVEFHAQCLKTVTAITHVQTGSTDPLPSGYLSGCMYEVTARCRHRFTRMQT